MQSLNMKKLSKYEKLINKIKSDITIREILQNLPKK